MTREELVRQIEVAQRYGLVAAAADYRRQLQELDQADQRGVVAVLQTMVGIDKGAEHDNG